jgi:hypothetical protein
MVSTRSAHAILVRPYREDKIKAKGLEEKGSSSGIVLVKPETLSSNQYCQKSHFIQTLLVKVVTVVHPGVRGGDTGRGPHEEEEVPFEDPEKVLRPGRKGTCVWP